LVLAGIAHAAGAQVQPQAHETRAKTPTPTPARPQTELTFAASLRHGAYRQEGAPSVLVHVPAGFDPAPPLELVVFLHGFMGCAQVLIADGRAACRAGDREQDGWALGRHHDAARTNSVLVVPQLAFMQRSAKPGCFVRRGCFDAFLDELVAELRARLSLPQLNSARTRLTLVAHSGGYQTALAILARSRAAQRVQHVILMDALYGGAPELASWLQRSARRGARVLSIHLGAGATRRGSKDLYRRARRTLGDERVADLRAAQLDAALAGDEKLKGKALLVAQGRGAHRSVPESYLTRVLAAWLPGRK
jgi:pimeloyl-ACP methyl ester carboxylesterase